MKAFGYEEVVWWMPSLWSDQALGMLCVLMSASAAIILFKALNQED